MSILSRLLILNILKFQDFLDSTLSKNINWDLNQTC